jgi:hypothetical protein
MDINKYSEKKEKGLIQLQKLGSAYALISRRFDQETGAELDPEIISVNQDELVQQRDTLMAQANTINELLSDMEGINSQE